MHKSVIGIVSTCLTITSFNINAAYVSAKDILVSGAGFTDGIYFIDPDGAGGNAPFEIYADMTTDGGGWTLGVNSLSGDVSATTDMVSNTGTVGLTSGHTRDLAHLAIDRDAQIRHRLVDFDGTVLFDGYYTGNYHGTLGNAGDWTVLAGDVNILSYHFGRAWSTSSNDVDAWGGNCASNYGDIPWYYGACFTTIPTTGLINYNNPPYGYSSADPIGSYSIYVRELETPSMPSVPIPAAVWLFGSGLIGLVGIARRKQSVYGV